MPHYVDLNDVRTFVLAAQAGTMSAAAKTLHQPASTVSRSLTRLERHLGVLLAHRGPKGLGLTDAGKEYLLACRRALLRPKWHYQDRVPAEYGPRDTRALA